MQQSNQLLACGTGRSLYPLVIAALYAMIKLSSLIAILLVLPLKVIGCPLEGYWKSDEEKTLVSVRQAKDVTPKQKAVFENNFFGKLYLHIECGKFTSVMGDWVETINYELLSSSSKAVTIKYFSDLEGEVIHEAKIEGSCYSLEINGGQFKEYFCPVSIEEYNNAFKFVLKTTPDGQ